VQVDLNEHRVVHFDKYDDRGAYHWNECSPDSPAFNPPLVARYAVVKKAVEQLPRRRHVLDVGCGDAYLIASVRHLADKVQGVDPEAAAVALATDILKPWPHCSVAQGDCYALPFADGQFDTVLLTDVIEHLTEPEACLAEIARVLTDDGVLILTTPKFRPDRKWDDRHEREYRENELRELILTQFADVQISFFWPLVWCRLYNTRLGWRLCKWLGRLIWNPFLRESTTASERFGQLKAVCRVPRRAPREKPAAI
jgi:SAM-dependent methyltransferase